MPYVTPLIPSQTTIKRGPRTPSTELVLKSSRLDTAEDGEYESIQSNIRILICGLQCYSLHYQEFTVQDLENY